jgi:hypothetical protein
MGNEKQVVKPDAALRVVEASDPLESLVEQAVVESEAPEALGNLHKCKTDGCETLLSEGSPDTCPRCQEDKSNAKKKVKFAKRFTVADVFTLPDGSLFSFRKIKRNDGSGFAPSSEHETDDEVLIEILREAAKNPATGVVEI